MTTKTGTKPKTPAKDKPGKPTEPAPDVGAMTGPELADWLETWCRGMTFVPEEGAAMSRILAFLRGTKGRRKCCDSRRGKDVPHADGCPTFLADGTFRPVGEAAAE